MSISFWNVSAEAQQRCENVFDPASSESNSLLHFSGQHFDYFILGTLAKNESSWWNKAIAAATESDTQSLKSLYNNIPADIDRGRAVRLLMLAEDHGVRSPDFMSNDVLKARIERQNLRATTMEVEGELSATQMKDLTNMLTMLGIRRSKAERLFERLKDKVGFKSAEHIPVIQADKASNILGDEARLALLHYNNNVIQNPENVKAAFKALMNDPFQAYSQRVYQNLKEPWFVVDGKSMNLNDFINSEAYRQETVKPGNTWMNVVRLTPDKVQNPMFKGHVREMWWNRKDSINPIGTVRISRNMLVDENGVEKLVSVEVLRRGDDGIFVPYLFEADIQGKLQPKEGQDALQKMKSCVQCHLRLSGVLFGGITMPNYKAVNDWHINNIDFTKRTSYEKFKAFR